MDGTPIPAATVSFVSIDKKDTVMMAANDSGIAITDKIKSVSGEVRISAVGYETVSQPFSNSSLKKVHEIKLSRNIKACQLVIINTISEYRRISCGFSVRYVKSTQENENQQPKSIMKLYPNPVSRGSAIKIQFELAESENINIRIINLTGTILSSQNFLASESLNSLSISTDSRWAAGIYLLQVYAKGKLLASDKIIIQ